MCALLFNRGVCAIARLAVLRTLHLAVITVLALTFTACAGVEVTMPSSGLGMPQVVRHVPDEMLEALARAKPCCASLSELRYRSFEHEGSITLDIGLPDMDGWALLDLLKHDPRTRHVPINVISVDDAMAASDNPDALKLELRGITRGARAGSNYDPVAQNY